MSAPRLASGLRRAAGLAALAALTAVALAGCASRSSSPAQSTYGSAAAGAQPALAEGVRSAAPRQQQSAYLVLPGSANRELVRYDVVNGTAVMDGDIVLGPANALSMMYAMPAALGALLPGLGGPGAGTGTGTGTTLGAVALANTAYLWPNGVIPYQIDGSVSPQMIEYIQWAVAQANTTELEMRPRVPGDSAWVTFREMGDGCHSSLGRRGGEQSISTTGCARGSVLHEIMHAAGFYHEQSRGDRDAYVTIAWNEIDPASASNFEKRDATGRDIGAYDYASIMHYGATAFSRSGRPTIIPNTPGVSIGQRDGLSQLDRAAVRQLYGNGAASVPGSSTNTAQPGAGANGSFAGQYSSQQGAVTCTQNGSSVSCQFAGGSLLCAAVGQELSCGWSGSAGSGRAQFVRQSNGVLAGTWGDMLSTNSRGAWDLTPAGGSAPAPAPAGTQPATNGWPGGWQLPFPPPPLPFQLPTW